MKAFIGTFVLISCVFTPCRSQEPAVQIADIEVRLFYHDSGTFSRDITMADRPDFGLWNTLIGKGDAKEPSSAVLATVVLLGPPGASKRGISLQLEARESVGDVHYVSSAEAAEFGSSGQCHISFLVAEVACLDLRLIARLEGQPESLLEEQVTFHCGE